MDVKELNLKHELIQNSVSVFNLWFYFLVMWKEIREQYTVDKYNNMSVFVSLIE